MPATCGRHVQPLYSLWGLKPNRIQSGAIETEPSIITATSLLLGTVWGRGTGGAAAKAVRRANGEQQALPVPDWAGRNRNCSAAAEGLACDAKRPSEHSVRQMPCAVAAGPSDSAASIVPEMIAAAAAATAVVVVPHIVVVVAAADGGAVDAASAAAFAAAEWLADQPKTAELLCCGVLSACLAGGVH